MLRSNKSTIKPLLTEVFNMVLNSYSQIFFSTHKAFALLIMLVTFFDFYAGIFGFVAVLTTVITSLVLGFNKKVLEKGILGFNSLLVGLGLGVFFTPSVYLLLIVVLAAIFTLFISVSLQGVIGKYELPFLSIPFIVAMWAFMLAANSFNSLGINERGIFTINELYTLGGQSLIEVYDYFNQLNIWNPVRAYLISLSAILFQFNLLTGLIMAIGLLLFSRIAFSLSLIGFFIAYGFYHVIGAEITHYDYSFFGFNYILSSIALGGFFLIPSRNSFSWMILLIPFVAILTISLNMVFIQFKLPIYSLPFNLVVLLFIYTLKFRDKYSYSLSEVYFQHNAPEKNLYIFLNNKDRFRYKLFTAIKLPFFGTWKVSQAENGEYTHQGEYKHAWDFIIENKGGKQFKNKGDYREDYYCYNKPIIAPENGTIEFVLNGIEDNIIGQTNLKDNWGNTVIIKHNEGVYTKLCHLKNNSIKVKKGDEVKFGQVIAHCGNSGRSPYPHLHFQVQPYAYKGSVTSDYPLSNYIENSNNKYNLKTHSKPQKDQLVSNIEAIDVMVSALNFIPGQLIKYKITDNYQDITVTWEVKVNEYNQSYIYCPESKAKAFFENDKNLFYFTYFEGSRKGYLLFFFQAIFKLQKGFYKNINIRDRFPLYLTYPKHVLWFYDFISPFTGLAKSEYNVAYHDVYDLLTSSRLKLESSMTNFFGKVQLNKQNYTIIMNSSGIASITTSVNNRNIEFTLL